MDLTGKAAAMYLRKSRAEDGLDTAEILRRHRETLTEYADRAHLRIGETYAEVRSGESLYARPEMLRLMADVEAGRWDAVLCMDLDRLSRGGTRDRGTILETIKDAGTLIVTPSKVYDLTQESDELLAEVGGLVANLELRQIRKRLTRGKLRAAQEGGYMGYAPYGYRKARRGRLATLDICEQEAAHVRLIFSWYASGVGAETIASRLNAMGARPRRAEAFKAVTIRKMLRNPVYIGKIAFNREQWTNKNGTRAASKRPEGDWIMTDGIHHPIVDMETWDAVQDSLQHRSRQPYYDGHIKSPLAGLVRCHNCGGRMHKIGHKGVNYLHCLKKGCCASAQYDLVEDRVIETLSDILEGLELGPETRAEQEVEAAELRLRTIGDSITAADRRRARILAAYEDGAIDLPTLRDRQAAHEAAIRDLRAQEADAKAALEAAKSRDTAQQEAQIRNALSLYWTADAQERNRLLRGVVDVIWYSKEKGSLPAAFTLRIALR